MSFFSSMKLKVYASPNKDAVKKISCKSGNTVDEVAKKAAKKFKLDPSRTYSLHLHLSPDVPAIPLEGDMVLADMAEKFPNAQLFALIVRRSAYGMQHIQRSDTAPVFRPASEGSARARGGSYSSFPTEPRASSGLYPDLGDRLGAEPSTEPRSMGRAASFSGRPSSSISQPLLSPRSQSLLLQPTRSLYTPLHEAKSLVEVKPLGDEEGGIDGSAHAPAIMRADAVLDEISDCLFKIGDHTGNEMTVERSWLSYVDDVQRTPLSSIAQVDDSVMASGYSTDSSATSLGVSMSTSAHIGTSNCSPLWLSSVPAAVLETPLLMSLCDDAESANRVAEAWETFAPDVSRAVSMARTWGNYVSMGFESSLAQLAAQMCGDDQEKGLEFLGTYGELLHRTGCPVEWIVRGVRELGNSPEVMKLVQGLQMLTEMGYPVERARRALISCKLDSQAAAVFLLDNS